MARVTVEDCLDNVTNKFELAAIASKRARQLARGAVSQLEWEDDKPSVMALREIAEGLISHEMLDSQEVSTEDEEVELSFSLGGGLPEDRLGDDEPV